MILLHMYQLNVYSALKFWHLETSETRNDKLPFDFTLTHHFKYVLYPCLYIVNIVTLKKH